MSKHRKFTVAEKEKANQTDMIDFLWRRYNLEFKKVGREYHCTDHNSFVINSDRRGYHWNSQDLHGSGAISFLMKYERMSYPEAIEELIGADFTSAPIVQHTEKKIHTGEYETVTLPPKTDGMYRNAFAYLNRTRGICKNIISDLIRDGKIYQEAKKNNVVFVNYNDAGKATFWNMRGTNTKYKFHMNVPHADPDNPKEFENYGFWLTGTNKESVYVFEAPLDLLSHASIAVLQTGKASAYKTHNRIALCGKHDIALEQFLKTHPEVRMINFVLDRDEPGQLATKNLMEKYSKLGYSCADKSDKLKLSYGEKTVQFKDVNDYLLALESKREETSLTR